MTLMSLHLPWEANRRPHHTSQVLAKIQNLEICTAEPRSKFRKKEQHCSFSKSHCPKTNTESKPMSCDQDKGKVTDTCQG